MQMKKKVLAAALTGLLASSGAFAGVDLDASPAAPNVYASELVAAGVALTTGLAGDVVLTSKLGFGVSNTQTRYIRVDLGNATLGDGVVAGDLTLGASAAAVVQGGAGTDNFVIIQITAGADFAAGDTFTLDLDGMEVTSAAAPVTVSYSLYEDAPSAAAGGTTGRIYAKSGTLATFASGLDYDVTAGSNTASVDADYKEFTSASAAIDLAALGVVKLAATTNVLTPAGAAVTLANLLANGTKLVVAGDFSAADATVNGGVYLDNADNCGTSTVAGVLNDALTQATLTTNENAVAAGTNVCYAVTGAAQIEEQTATVALDVTPDAAATTADVAAQTLGTIDRDGTRLMAPLVQVPAGWVSRLVLTNTGTRDRAYSLAVQGEDGNTISTGALTGTILAGKTVVIDSSTVLTGFTGASRATVSATVAAPTNQIQGLYQIVNPTSGSISNHVMVRPGTN